MSKPTESANSSLHSNSAWARGTENRGRLLPELASLMSQAGARILELAAKGVHGRAKPDQSVVTEADDAAEAIILQGIERILPGVPIVAEEAVARGKAGAGGDAFFLVDPLDGTREFLDGTPEFTVNVAVVLEGEPVLGLVYVPAEGTLYAGGDGHALRAKLAPGARYAAAAAAPIRARARPERLVAAVSRSHLDAASEAFLGRLPVERRIRLGSAVKFCRIAEGEVDVYPRLAPVHEWDAAAGHALVVAAGGSVTAADGSALTYGRADKRWLIDGFVAWGAAGRF
jgi:3'(2'), 5'-bisphosphate nucleotidase